MARTWVQNELSSAVFRKETCGKRTTSCCPTSAQTTTVWKLVNTLYGEGLLSRHLERAVMVDAMRVTTLSEKPPTCREFLN